jgi:hypothetical protein
VVLDRDRLEWSVLAGLLCPALFLAVGVAGLVASWRKTFPRGVAVDTLDLLRRLPRQFYAAGAAALLVAGVVVWTLRTYGSALGGWVCPLLVAGGGLVFLLARSALRYGSVVLPSPEKRAASEREGSAPPAGAGAAADFDGDRAEGVVVGRGRRLPVRLSPDWPGGPAGGACLVTFGVLVFLAMALTVLTVRAAKGEGPPGLPPALAVLGLVVFAAAVAVGRRSFRRARGLAVELSGHPLRAGEKYRVAVHHPEPGVLGHLRLTLVCEEEATTVGGKGSSTTRHTASRQPVTLGEPHGPGDVREGRLDVPAGAPPSFRLTNHRVAWYLEVLLGRWPAWRTRCPVTVEAVGRAAQPAGEGAVRVEDDRVSLWVDGGRSVFRPGDVLAGGCAVHAGDAGPLRTAELSVLWQTEPPGTAELGVCHYEEHAAVEGDAGPLYGRRSFRVRLPGGPPSHDGRAVKVRWAVRLRLRYASGEEVVREVPFLLAPAAGPPATGR